MSSSHQFASACGTLSFSLWRFAYYNQMKLNSKTITRIEKSVLATKNIKLQAITFQKTLFYTNRQLVTVTTKVVSKQARDHRTKLSMFFSLATDTVRRFFLLGDVKLNFYPTYIVLLISANSTSRRSKFQVIILKSFKVNPEPHNYWKTKKNMVEAYRRSASCTIFSTVTSTEILQSVCYKFCNALYQKTLKFYRSNIYLEITF